MKYGRNNIKDIFRDGISCLYLDEEQDDFCNFVEKLQQENQQLKQEKEDTIKFLKERFCLLTTKTPNAKENITTYHHEINGRSKRAGLLQLSKEELVRIIFDLNNSYTQLVKKVGRNKE